MKKTLLLIVVLLCHWIDIFAQIDETDPTLENEYDVGVFYMPFWSNNRVPDPDNPSDPWLPVPYHIGKAGSNISAGNGYTYGQMMYQSHWDIMADYHQYMINNGHTGGWDNYRKISTPPNMWYVDKPNASNGFGLYDSPGVWYNETVKEVVEEQTHVMKQYDIDFVIYNWYWNYCGCGGNNLTDPYNNDKWRTFWEQSQEHWLDPTFDNNGVDLAIFWSGDYEDLIVGLTDSINKGNPQGAAGFFDSGKGLDKMAARMAEYMNAVDSNSNPRYKIKNNENVLYVYYAHLYGMMSLPEVANHALFTGITNVNLRIKELLDMLDDRLYNLTGRHTYFVGYVSEPPSTFVNQESFLNSNTTKKSWLIDGPNTAGIDAITTYNYKQYDYWDTWDSGNSNTNPNIDPIYNELYDYSTLISIFSKYYNFYKYYNNTSMKYQVPVTEGWNRAPGNMRDAGGEDGTGPIRPTWDWASNNHLSTKNHATLKANEFKATVWDNANSTPSLYNSALLSAKNFIDANETLTDKTAILCCWNEHAEGTVIEPTFAWGHQYLQKVKDVFKSTLIFPSINGKNTELEPNFNSAPESFTLSQNQPNPVKDITIVNYSIPKEGLVIAKITDSQGKVFELINEVHTPGNYQLEWFSENSQNGVYILKMEYFGEFKNIKILVQH
ncbi:glycoside hydrolase family 99-like domain-containing protein [uncultured Roseivirga sp.]|uniref:T9SS type A sorting domain-containing protein n=1 Tax=uncultured Roseivirga sp. TaxID=543088 RepID=UPI002585FCD1|nr:glycoside hydrolase family 99-like domain-containing protein [uncultured Roseivirga sp.]